MFLSQDGLLRAKAQANDESYYLWAMKFFMEFNRNYKFQVKLVRFVLLYIYFSPVTETLKCLIY
jgi:timeless